MWALPLRVALPVLAVVGVLAAPAHAAAPAGGEGGKPYLDVREGPRAEAVAERRTAADVPAGHDRAARALVRAEGAQATLELDPTTATVRSLADLAGTLTGPSGGDPRDLALGYVRAHLAALGLTEADLDTLGEPSATTGTDGVTIVRWGQERAGVAMYDNGLTVAVDRAGRVLSVGGSPLHDPEPNTTTPSVSAAEAVATVSDSVGAQGGAATRSPEPVYFDVNGALRLAWRVEYRASPTALYDAVVDATSGRVLHRANLVKFANYSVSVFPHYPGAPAGGAQVSATIDSTSTTQLRNTNADLYADLNDNDKNDGGSENVSPTATSTFNTLYALVRPNCIATALCSWSPVSGSSWATNKAQNAIQAYWFVNAFHDHLAAAPIGFTSASGAFEGADRVIVNTDDGANKAGGLPDSGHLNNANMATPADGTSPRMQMYLFGNSSWFRDINGGDSAEIVFHEYTHGLSSRLVHGASGNQALNVAQAGAMGEAWSDWYAMDFLNRGDAAPKGMGSVLVPDTPAPGEVDLGAYTDAVANVIRTQPLDCPVGAAASACPGSGQAGSGGYTYGDLGEICGCGAEVHADGEIWGETLWDLRTRLIADLGSVTAGADAAEALVTGAMRLSPPEPSFLDMRNAMLLADTSLGGAYRTAIWDVFAARGMGFFAGAIDGGDVAPAEDFSLPPAGTPTASLSGTITDALSGRPVSGLKVSIGGHTNGDSVFTATTDSAGHYLLSALPAGTYGKVFVLSDHGYDGTVQRNVAVTGATTLDFVLRHNWAAAASGGRVDSTNDDYYANYSCGAAAVIDGNQGNGWSAWRPGSPNYPQSLTGAAPTVTIALPQVIDVASFAVDPGATCGDDSASTAKTFTIETSPDASAWTMAYDGRSASTDFDAADAGTMKPLVPTDGADQVRYVRLTLYAPQSTASGGSGRDFIDLSEFAVYGNAPPTAALSVPGVAVAGVPVTLDASGSTDDGTIASYAWDFDGDGTFDETTTTAQVQHAYGHEGTFIPAVRVTDDHGATAQAVGTPVVVAPAPAPLVDTPSGTPAVPDPSGTPTGGTTTVPGGATGGTDEQDQGVAGFPGTSPGIPTPVPAPAVGVLRTGRRGGVTVAVLCPLACTGTATLQVSAATARRLGIARRTVGSLAFPSLVGAHTFSVPVRPSMRLRMRAKHIRSLRLALALAVTDSRGRTSRLAARPRVWP